MPRPSVPFHLSLVGQFYHFNHFLTKPLIPKSSTVILICKRKKTGLILSYTFSISIPKLPYTTATLMPKFGGCLWPLGHNIKWIYYFGTQYKCISIVMPNSKIKWLLRFSPVQINLNSCPFLLFLYPTPYPNSRSHLLRSWGLIQSIFPTFNSILSYFISF